MVVAKFRWMTRYSTSAGQAAPVVMRDCRVQLYRSGCASPICSTSKYNVVDLRSYMYRDMAS